MSSSDYVSLKKKKIMNHNNKFNKLQNPCSNYTEELELMTIQNTIALNEDNELTYTNRYNIELKNSIKPTKNKKTLPLMYSIPRIRSNEYIKNRYQSPFCWTCFEPIDTIFNNFACTLCEQLMELTELSDSIHYNIKYKSK